MKTKLRTIAGYLLGMSGYLMLFFGAALVQIADNLFKINSQKQEH